MDFSQLKTEICDEIESIIAEYWSSHCLPAEPRRGGRRRRVDRVLPGGLQRREGRAALVFTGSVNGRELLRRARERGIAPFVVTK